MGKKIEKAKKKRIIKLSVIGFVIVALGVLFFGAEKASWYSEEQHTQRVTKRIEKNYMTEKYDFTSFEVYPLYDIDDKLVCFLVEFEPNDYLYVQVREENKFFLSVFWGTRGLYGQDWGEREWSRYTVDETNSQPYPYEDRIWFEFDENGERIVYDQSPYAVAGIENERRYLLLDIEDLQGNEYDIPAVKRDGEFINLISMTPFNTEYGKLTEKQASARIHFIPKNMFDLV